MGQPTTRILLDKRQKRKDGTFPVRLRVTQNKTQKYFSLGITMTEEDWEKTTDQNAKKKHKETKIYLEKIEERAFGVIREIHPFSFEVFKQKFNGTSSSQKDALWVFQEYISGVSKEDRVRTADSYKNALVSIKGFLATKNRKNLSFDEITVDWLKSYEDWMIERNRAVSTIGIYLRSLRTIVNIAVLEGVLKAEQYPFGKRKYKIPDSENIKKALVSSDIKKVYEYNPANEAESRAKDMWIFTYLCNGINFKDIAKLRYMDISDTSIKFFRSKIERSGREKMRPITVPLSPEVKAIIDKWGVKPVSPKTYIFGIISVGDTKKEQDKKIQQALKINNKYTKRIGIALDLPFKLTTYVARHSFATMLKRKNASVTFISESLGHKDLKTTQNYLDSFEDSTKLEFQSKLLDFDD